jgi:hypothetical protein
VFPRYAWFIARRSGYRGGPEPTWRTASFGAKVASLAVLAMLGSLAAFLSIPVMAAIAAAWGAL